MKEILNFLHHCFISLFSCCFSFLEYIHHNTNNTISKEHPPEELNTIVNDFKSLTFVGKLSISDVCDGSG